MSQLIGRAAVLGLYEQLRRFAGGRGFFARRAVARASGWPTLWLLMATCTSAGADPLRLAVSSGVVSLPVYVAEAKGFFHQEGAAVRLIECSSGRQCFEMLGQDKADVATAAELIMTLNRLAGSDAAIIATLSASSQQMKLVARSTGGNPHPAELRGKRIGTVRSTSAEYFLDSWLVYNDIDPLAVTVVPLAPDRLLDALKTQEIDAVAIWEPIASLAAAQLGPQARMFSSGSVYVQHFSLIASRAALDRRNADLIRLLRALAKAERFIADYPAEAHSLLATRLGIAGKPGDLAENDFRLVLDQSLIGTMEAVARWAKRRGLVRPDQGGASLLHAIEAGPLRAVAPDLVGLVR